MRKFQHLLGVLAILFGVVCVLIAVMNITAVSPGRDLSDLMYYGVIFIALGALSYAGYSSGTWILSGLSFLIGLRIIMDATLSAPLSMAIMNACYGALFLIPGFFLILKTWSEK